MQGINAKDHQALLATFNKFEQMATIAEDYISSEDNLKTREGVAELHSIYNDFKQMMQQLQYCVQQYEDRRRSVQSRLNRSIRQMNSKVQARKRYLK